MAAARRGDPPWFIVSYGDSDTGKSADAAMTSPRAKWMGTATNQTACAVRLTGGLRPPLHVVSTLQQATQHVKSKGRALARSMDVPVLVMDDFSVLVMNTWSRMYRQMSGWDLWMALKGRIIEFREALTESGLNCHLTCHLDVPEKDDKGNQWKGSPQMPSRKLRAVLPHVATLCLLTRKTADFAPGLWAGRYVRMTESALYYTKDRYGVLPTGESPMNLREILVRANEQGHRLAVPRRMAGCEWLDAAVEEIAQGIAAGKLPADPLVGAPMVMARFRARAKHPAHVRWALRDGYDRATLRAANDPLMGIFTPGAA